MKVLVLTSLYHIQGRENLGRNTSAIHYLLKYWPSEAEIMVIHEYHVYAKHLKRYLSKKERSYLKNGYHFEADGISVHMVELPLFPKQRILVGFQKNYMVSRITSILQEADFVPDVIICHQPSCYVGQYVNELSFDAKKIAVLHITDVQYCAREKRFSESLSNNFDAVFCRSKAIYRKMEQYGIPGLREGIIESGVPAFKASIEKHWCTDSLEIVYVGKLTKRKHVDDVLLAMANVIAKRKFHFTIVGTGPEERKLKILCEKLNLTDRVTFAGQMPREMVYEYYGTSDVFVMPSTGETLGLVYLESMRQGCIPIGTQGEGIDGIILDGVNGYLVPPSDPHALSSVLARILDASESELRAMSVSAQGTGDEFDEKSKGMQYYYRICGEFNESTEFCS